MKKTKNTMKVNKKTKSAKHNSGMADPQLPPMPTRKRIVFQDPTTAVMQVRCKENPKGVLWVRDELAGLIGGMGRFGGSDSSDRTFLLEGHTGHAFKVDRKSDLDNPIFISHLSISLLGGMQPDKLAEVLLSGADDGLAARFLYTWPAKPDFTFSEDLFEGHDAAKTAFAKLAALQPRYDLDGNVILTQVKFSEKAKLKHRQWAKKQQENLDQYGGMLAGHLGKYSGQAVRLATVLEFLWWASKSEEPVEPSKISLKAVSVAIKLLETYFKPMAIRAFSEAGTPVAQRDATTLAKKIMASKLKHVNVREVYRTFKLPGLNKRDAVTAALSELEAAGWVRPKPSRAGNGYGRARNDYEVNPSIYQ